tara:strand:+ start:1172 stop:2143 length:972 start_codon:yes stop_codon:yes gene_type:complete
MAQKLALQKNARITVFGGTGFVGRHTVRRLAKAGYQIRVATRRPNEALHLKTGGKPGQIEIVQANIRDDASVANALEGADAAINAVGILFETGKQKFATVQAQGGVRVAKAAAAEKIKNFVHISAIGADAQSASLYAQSKAAAEHGVLEALPTAHILRPSIVIGPEDDFFNRFAGLAMVAPALPLIGGGTTRYQPVSVFDVAAAVEACLTGTQARAPSGTYELGGPDVLTFKQLMELLLVEIGRNRLLVPMPFLAARVIASVAQFMPKPLLTPDQLILLKSDNLVGDNAMGFDTLGLKPTPIAALLPDYLWRFRPSGKKPTKV